MKTSLVTVNVRNWNAVIVSVVTKKIHVAVQRVNV